MSARSLPSFVGLLETILAEKIALIRLRLRILRVSVMMVGRSDERFAAVVAENVVTTCEWFRNGRRFSAEEQQRITGELVREISAFIPAASSATLAQVCKRILSDMSDGGVALPQVVSVDMDEGFVRMRPA